MEGQKSGTNWLAIVLGVILVGIICVGGFFGLQYIMGNDGTETEQPPPGETIIVPTVIVPTQEIPPTQPPEQPTQPPEIPTEEPPVEEPPTEGPPPEETPAQLPEVLPEEPGGSPGGGLPDVCGSVGSVGVGIGLVSLTAFKKRRSRS